jgi:ergothioneine biosynthesis protein EgtB
VTGPRVDIPGASRVELLRWYDRNRLKTRELFDLLDPAVYYTRPIALRNPIVFYEGHLPAFSIIAFLRRGLGAPPVDERLETLFARGIDPESAETAVPRSGVSTVWPQRSAVLAFGSAADAAVREAIETAAFDESRPAMRRWEGLFTALEHEAMHQETLLYMWHRLPHDQKRRPANLRYEFGDPPPHRVVQITAGTATLGARPERVLFGWDNEFDEHQVDVPEFEIDAHSVTNADFLEFVRAGGYHSRELWSDEGWAWREKEGVEHPAFWIPAGARPERAVDHTRVEGYAWRGMFEFIPLPLSWPVYVSLAEAEAFARWRGRRIPTEAEYHRAAFGTPDGGERRYPWGDAPADARHGNFDFASWEPVPAGARPAGTSAWGVHDLIGNGWEWTSTIFAPFRGFEAMPSYPEYSAEFFDGMHYVMKGASPGTARELVRRSFRNWFRGNYPYVYAKFRTAR